MAVENSFFESIDEQLAARTTLQLQLPEVCGIMCIAGFNEPGFIKQEI